MNELKENVEINGAGAQRFFFLCWWRGLAVGCVWLRAVGCELLLARRLSYMYFVMLGTTKAMRTRTIRTRKLGWSWLVLKRVCMMLLIKRTFPVLGKTAQRVVYSQMLPFSSGFIGTAMIASTNVMAMEKPLQQVAR